MFRLQGPHHYLQWSTAHETIFPEQNSLLPLKLTLIVVESPSCVWLLRPHGVQPTRLHCPWYFPDKNIRVGCRFLLQGIFQTTDWCWIFWIGRRFHYKWANREAHYLNYWASQLLLDYKLEICVFWLFLPISPASNLCLWELPICFSKLFLFFSFFI